MKARLSTLFVLLIFVVGIAFALGTAEKQPAGKKQVSRYAKTQVPAKIQQQHVTVAQQNKQRTSTTKRIAGSAPMDVDGIADRDSRDGEKMNVLPRRTPLHPERFKPQFGTAVRFGLTPPVSSMQPPSHVQLAGGTTGKKKGKGGGQPEEVENLELPWSNLGNESPGSVDTLLIGPDTVRAPNVLPGPTVSFEGPNFQNNVDMNGGFFIPPDTNGDVGPNHYVETVNIVFQIYDKTGTPLIPPLPVSNLFTSIGGVCSDTDRGDPVVLYDPMADRWLISQFGFDTIAGIGFPPPTHQCVAISQTGDPTGAYFAYDFIMPGTKFHDYPHYGVWPDAYYMTSNLFNPSGTAFVGTGVAAYDRNKMLAGDPSAGFVYFDLEDFDPNIGGTLPSDLDGLVPPPPGTPNYIGMFVADEPGFGGVDGMRIFEDHVDFAIPANSTFTERADSPVLTAPFNPQNPAGRGDIPQPPPATGTGSNLDSISDRILHRLQYRNFGSYETLTVNHTVEVDPGPAYQAGVRYHEFHRPLPGGNFTIFNEGSIALTPENRWMGSAALDNKGNLAVGYSVSSATTFPSIRYFGRRADLTIEGETTLIAGSGSQTAGNPGAPAGQRWGDYSAISVDPTDDCSFWYTQEYYTTSDVTPADIPFGRNWQNRVGKFAFPSTICTPPAQGTLNGSVTDSVSLGGIIGARVVAVDSNGNMFEAAANGTGAFARLLAPGSYTLTAKASGYDDSAPAPVVITNGGITTQNFSLSARPVLAFSSSTVDDTAGNNNGNLDQNECANLNLTLANNGPASSTAMGVSATLVSDTAGVTVSASTATRTYPNISGGGGTSTNTSPFQISISPAFVCGTPINMTLNVSTTQGSFAVPVLLKSGTPNVFTFSASGPVPIPDGTGIPIDVSIPVAGVVGTVTKVKVSVVMTTAQNADIDMFILNPLATSVELSTDNGSRGDNFGASCPAGDDDAVFDMNAATSILSTASPLIGHFRPEGNLNTFNGVDPNGTWDLRVFDDTAFIPATGESGPATFQCVTLTIETQPVCTGGPGVCGEAVPVLDVATSTVTGGNGDSDADVHECFNLDLGVRNDGTSNATGTPISATLTTTTPGVTILQGSSNYSGPVAPGATATNTTPFQVQTSASFVCDTPIDLHLNVTTDQGVFDLPFELPTGSLVSTSASNGTPVPIPTASTITSSVTISGLGGTVKDASLSLRLTFPNNGQLALGLQGPDGTFIDLASFVGNTSDGFGTDCPADGNDAVFTDNAVNLISVAQGTPNGSAIIGSFKPEEAFSAFHGKDPNGTWTLVVFNGSGNPINVGTLNCWSFNVSTTECQNGNCCPTITLSPATFPDGFTGIPYDQTISASGGATPYSFAVTSGGLPTGLSLDSSTGEISGTPTATGAFSFDITATDADGCTGTQSYTVNVSDCPAITLTPATLPDAPIGLSYFQTVSGNGGTGPYTFAVTSGTLPTGTTLNPTTGVLSGTLTELGSFNFTITATDANGCSGSQAYTINVTCPTITVSPSTLPDGTVGVAYSQTVSASGGTAPYAFSVTAGTLPAGLSLNSSTGEISGTPTTTGTSNFSITATDAFGCTGSQAYSITINFPCVPLVFSPATLPDGTVGVAYNQTVTATNGTAPITYSVSAGALPAGLSLNSANGDITGTPTTAGTSNFTISAVDNNGCTGSQAYSITIDSACVPLVFSPTTLPDGTVGTAYSQTVTATNGTAPITYSVSAGALPAGLTLNTATGEISGTPTTVETANFTISAVDNDGCTGSQAYTVNIVASCLYCDEFDDNTVNAGWTYNHISDWSESGTLLSVNAPKKSYAIAAVFAGCQLCSAATSMSTTDDSSKVSFYSSYNDKKHAMEALFKFGGNKIVLKQRNGTVVKKQAIAFSLDANTTYQVTMTNDGTNVVLNVNGTDVATFATVGSLPPGTTGFQVVGDASFDYIHVN